MKKIYIIPSTEITLVELQQMIASTQIEMNGKYNGTAAIESRQSNGWDDEDY